MITVSRESPGFWSALTIWNPESKNSNTHYTNYKLYPTYKLYIMVYCNLTQCQIKSNWGQFSPEIKSPILNIFFRFIVRSNFWQLHLSLFRLQLYWTYHSTTSKVVYLTAIIKMKTSSFIDSDTKTNNVKLDQSGQVYHGFEWFDRLVTWTLINYQTTQTISVITLVKSSLDFFENKRLYIDWVNVKSRFLINYWI